MTGSWRGSTVSPCGTHHLSYGVPLYRARFDEVLPFHEPGLAPVLDGSGAYHIGIDGREAYPQRHLRTFGFYGGLAAVQDRDGWVHIGRDGQPAYEARHEWCGNFQEDRCAIRLVGGGYIHIDRDGVPVQENPCRYVGDFRKGIAVVQRDDGLHSHVDRSGQLVHDRWFVDLDVFHKGFARARDGSGWMHVDRSGRPVYARRFAMVEPFYNGQARVELLDGALEVIDEIGETIVELRPPRRSAFALLSGDIVGYWRTQTIRTAVLLGMPDALPGRTDEIAARCEVPVERAGRLLRGLGELGIVLRGADGWSLTDRGIHLRRDHPLSLADAAIEFGGRLARRWELLPDAMLADGSWSAEDVFEEVAGNTEDLAAHSRMLDAYARHDYELVSTVLDLADGEVLVDAGGGLGSLARALLQQHPRACVVLMDRPEVIELAARQSDSGDALEYLAADLFEPWPVTADAVVMARVLHDWDDERALTILRNARASLRQGGRLNIVEMLLPTDDMTGGLCDLHLLAVTGGQERTVEGYRVLLERSGFELVEVRQLPALPSVILGVAR